MAYLKSKASTKVLLIPLTHQIMSNRDLIQWAFANFCKNNKTQYFDLLQIISHRRKKRITAMQRPPQPNPWGLNHLCSPEINISYLKISKIIKFTLTSNWRGKEELFRHQGQYAQSRRTAQQMSILSSIKNNSLKFSTLFLRKSLLFKNLHLNPLRLCPQQRILGLSKLMG